jgi:hypothetical protein
MPTGGQHKRSMAKNLPHHTDWAYNTGGCRMKKNKDQIHRNGERYYVLYGEMRYAGLRVRRKYFHTYGEAYEFKNNNKETVL